MKKLLVPYNNFVVYSVSEFMLNTWKLNIFNIIDKRISNFISKIDLLPSKPQFTCSYLKKGVQKLHKKKAAYDVMLTTLWLFDKCTTSTS